MSRLFRQITLKTVKKANKGEYEISSVKAELDTAIRCLLDNIYFGNQKPSNNNVIKQSDNHIDNQNTICFFRGFTPYENESGDGRANAYYFHDLFIVGEKGKGFLERTGQDGQIRYYETGLCSDDALELLVTVNSKMKEKGFNPIEKRKIKPRITNDAKKAYMFLLNIAHNIGGAWSDKGRSPLVSASYGKRGYKTALKFAQDRNEQRRYSYIIMGFVRKDDTNNYVLTKDLCKILRDLGATWYKDVHSEIIIKDSIFPRNILGVFEIDKETHDIVFIVNPSLHQLFDKNYGGLCAKITNLICSKGIPVDQTEFDRAAAELGYAHYVEQDCRRENKLGDIGGDADSPLPNN